MAVTMAHPGRFSPIIVTSGEVLFPTLQAQNAFGIANIFEGPIKSKLFHSCDLVIAGLAPASTPTWEDPDAVWTFPTLNSTFNLIGTNGSFGDYTWGGSIGLGNASRTIYGESTTHAVQLTMSIIMEGTGLFPQSPANICYGVLQLRVEVQDVHNLINYFASPIDLTEKIGHSISMCGEAFEWGSGSGGSITVRPKPT